MLTRYPASCVVALTASATIIAILSSCSRNEPDYCNSPIEIIGTDDTDFLTGGPDDECIYGGNGNDVLSGGDGNDVLDSGEGSDAMQGGPGDDTFIVNLGDHMDVIADQGGQDTVQFGRGVTLDSISARMENGVLSIQIEDSGKWTYVTIAPGSPPDESVVEQFILPDGTRVTADDFLLAVSGDVMPIGAFASKVVEQRTVSISETDPDDEVFEAVVDTVRNMSGENLCVYPSLLSPKPDEYGAPTGRFRPEEYYAVFYGPPDGERSATQRKKFRALAIAGLMRKDEAISPDGVAGEKFSLTTDGWSYTNDGLCIHYGTLAVREVTSLLATGRKHDDAEIYSAKVVVGAENVELWAKEPDIQNSFPDLAQALAGRTIDAMVYKGDAGWVGVSRGGRPMTDTRSDRPDLPADRQLLSVKHRTNPGTLGNGSICLRPPLLGQGGYDDERGRYVTSAQEPYRGGNVENYERTKAYLDMLVSIGAATSGLELERSRAGTTVQYLEYEFDPELTFRDNTPRGLCMEVATTKFELLHAQWTAENRVLVKGQQRAYPARDWVLNPRFLAAHPDVAKQLESAQPVASSIYVYDRRDLRMENWYVLLPD